MYFYQNLIGCPASRAVFPLFLLRFNRAKKAPRKAFGVFSGNIQPKRHFRSKRKAISKVIVIAHFFLYLLNLWLFHLMILSTWRV